MVFKCAAYGCKSGYKSSTVDKDVTFHSFPRDEELRDRWIRANPRKDFIPTKHSRLCSLHFQPSDFVDERQDTNKSRLKQKGEKPVRRHLKEGVVPSVFPNTPAYLSKPVGGQRSTSRASSASRRADEEVKLEALEESFRDSDDISALSHAEIREKLEVETAVPQGFTVTSVDELLLIYLLQITDSIPIVVACITVNSDKTVVCSVDDKAVPASQYKDLLEGPVQQLSQLVNLMARVKSWHTDVSCRSFSFHIHTAIAVLDSALETLPDTESEEFRKVSFITEQLQLVVKKKYGRHYSPQLTVFSFMIHAATSAAYNVLLDEDILCLPSTSTLKKVTRKMNTSTSTDNSAYLTLRMSKLNAYERTVILIIDEIYIAKRVEYSGGEVHGLTADGQVASTLLCFMVKSLVSKYKDIVAIYPMDKLTAAKQYACYNDVMVLLHGIDVNVVAISVDNAATNRKFFTDYLCNGTLSTSITDATTNQPIFLLFDPVHSIKNVYNNFQSRKVFECPPMERNLPTGCCANFNDITELYKKESTMALKKAHRLTPSSLDPKSIEKTSVRLAVAVFSESTRDALQFYAIHEGHSDWSSTADFISLILKLWNIMNVKTRTKGKHKRDYTMDPIRSSLDWKLEFLREFADFLQRWESSGRPGLTKETFLALRHTCLALSDCASFLLDRRAHQYVLLGHLQSDAIESRFGWLRQLAGANYYISMRQVIEGDKKIRALSLLKFSNFTLAEISDATPQSDCVQSSAADDSLADVIADAVSYQHWPSSNDANIIYYVSGAIARSVVRSVKCDSCKETLISPDALEPLEVDESLDYSAAAFLDSVNRGGLARPAEYTFMLCVHCWRIFEDIRMNAQLKTTFLGATCQRSLFAKVVDRLSGDQLYGQVPVGDNFCVKGHDLKALIVQRFFNCVAKNLVKDLTSHASDHDQLSKRRKIAKLQSATHSSHP